MSPASGEDAGDVGWRRDGVVWAYPAAQAEISAPGAAARSACMTPVVSARRA
jgi:hypothetical protein